MDILDNFLILFLHVVCFAAGVMLANKYHREQDMAVKDALERQYLRLRAGADADDPAKPYVAQRKFRVMPTGDFDGDELPVNLKDNKTDNDAKRTARV